MKRSEGSVCYVATLNSSDSAPPQAVLNATAKVRFDENESDKESNIIETGIG